MSNQWSYDTPTEEGAYYLNRGDVVTVDSIRLAKLRKFNGHLIDDSGSRVFFYNNSFKWKKLDMVELNK